MKICYAVCDSFVVIDDGLRVRIKSELNKLVQKDEVSVFLNGFSGGNAGELETMLFEIGYSGDVNRMNLRSSMSGQYDVLMAIENGRTDHVIRLIRTAWSTNRKCSVIWI